MCMVYEALGIAVAQETVWPTVSRPDCAGRGTARTFLLAADALSRGWCASIVQARTPWETLAAWHAADLGIIINHRTGVVDPHGHYSVLVGLTAEVAVLHDPLAGPDQSVPRERFLELWQAFGARSEVAGGTAVLIAREPGRRRCTTCGTTWPESVPCIGCRQPIVLTPASAIGCAVSTCPARCWRQIYCSRCDSARRRVL